MPKITLGITGLPEILGRDHGIEEHYWEPSVDTYCFENGEKNLRFQKCPDTCGRGLIRVE